MSLYHADFQDWFYRATKFSNIKGFALGIAKQFSYMAWCELKKENNFFKTEFWIGDEVYFVIVHEDGSNSIKQGAIRQVSFVDNWDMYHAYGISDHKLMVHPKSVFKHKSGAEKLKKKLDEMLKDLDKKDKEIEEKEKNE